MKKNITDQALNIIRARKKKNQDIFKEKSTVLENDENFVKIEKEYLSLSIQNRKKEAYGQNCDKDEEERLLKILKDIKAEHGLEKLEMQYDCPLCKDEGYVDGKQCKCLKTEISKLLLKDSGFEKLENFDASIKTSEKLEPLYKKMKEWCNCKSAKNLIYFSGPSGVGKTHLLRCMANEFITNGKVVNIVTSLNLSLDFKTFSKTADEQLLKKYINPEVLFVDDLGTEPIFKNVTIEYLYLIINERKLRNKKTVITSNLGLEEISDRYDERIFSRIVDQNTSIAVFIDGKDRRLIKK